MPRHSLIVFLNCPKKIMKKIVIIFILVFQFFKFSHAQNLDSTLIKLDYGSKIREVQDFFNLEQIDYFAITSQDTSLKNYYFLFTSKEYRGKKSDPSKNIIRSNEAKAVSFGNGDTALVFSIMTKARGVEEIEFCYNLVKFRTSKFYKKTKSDAYSLRDAVNSHGKFVSVPLNKAFPLLVYSLPYEDPKRPGYLFYCELTAGGVAPEQWGERYGVKHYIVIELAILSKQ